MEVQLSPELEALIARKMASGRYQNPEQIIVESLKTTLLADEQRSEALSALKTLIEDGTEESAKARDWLRQSSEEFSKGN